MCVSVSQCLSAVCRFPRPQPPSRPLTPDISVDCVCFREAVCELVSCVHVLIGVYSTCMHILIRSTMQVPDNFLSHHHLCSKTQHEHTATL